MYNNSFILKDDVVLCHGWGRYRVHGRVQKSSKAGHLIDHLALHFPLFFPHQPGNQIQLFQASLLLVFHCVHLFLNQLQERTQTSPLITSTLQSIQTDRQMDGQRGSGISVLPKIHVLRLRPWGTRVPPSLKPRLKVGSEPRWCTGCPVPRTSPLSLNLFPLLSRTAQTS